MSRSAFTIAGAVALALSVSACDAATEGTDAANGEASAGPDAAAGAAPAPQTVPLTPSGPAAPLTPEPAEAEGVQDAASVVRVDPVSEGQAKLFGTAGGDPAMNGLYTYIAFYVAPSEPWTVYKLGDVLDYTVLSSSPGRVDLDLHKSTYDEASGQIGDRHRRVIVQWTMGSDEGPPTAVTVTPAQ
ncbi:hypothetical protein IP78_14345 [Brevundimonas sp. AAP58]|uniref:hypothetical protein n=1 Tax=Brevundimonas sp. AAP58 TaxID=1523422 RepID=UPI0006B9612A|nr:hypothetical protein [Brevundimonas sp. AAP58]KPF73998.1 hypothetical protein IP78_14345 [Brevundimonas sp. AAP58]